MPRGVGVRVPSAALIDCNKEGIFLWESHYFLLYLCAYIKTQKDEIYEDMYSVTAMGIVCGLW